MSRGKCLDVKGQETCVWPMARCIQKAVDSGWMRNTFKYDSENDLWQKGPDWKFRYTEKPSACRTLIHPESERESDGRKYSRME
jgi:hypothetical protein